MDDARAEVISKICNALAPYIDDAQTVKNICYIALENYEISPRKTEVGPYTGDKNSAFVNRFLLAKTTKGLSKRTLKYYKQILEIALNDIGKFADEITRDDIRVYLAKRQFSDKITAVSTNNELRVLKSFFSYLLTDELISRNPTLGIEPVKEPRTKKEAFTETEIEKIRIAATSIRDRALVELLLSTGCRASEAAAILLSEIDGSKILVHGKGSKDRYVYLSETAIIYVDKYLSMRSDNNPYLFPKGRSISDGNIKTLKQNWWMNPENIADGHMDHSSIGATIRKLGKRAGVEKCHPHRFRRTCATMALKRGMPIELVSMMLGHASIETTQIYLDIKEDDLEYAHRRYIG